MENVANILHAIKWWSSGKLQVYVIRSMKLNMLFCKYPDSDLTFLIIELQPKTYSGKP